MQGDGPAVAMPDDMGPFDPKARHQALEVLRHSTAHATAQAVQELFPGTQVTIGPVVEDGFYYDFARPTPFTPEDLEKIEARMRENMSDLRGVRIVPGSGVFTDAGGASGSTSFL